MSFSFFIFYTFTPLLICEHHCFECPHRDELLSTCAVSITAVELDRTKHFSVPLVSVTGFYLALMSYHSETLSA